ncbi:MAG: hypothetical protein HY063_09845 [Bacteroidetes bacterium]|nr:hypothetical protein [Bacteroidota bacterium]
MKGLIKLHHLIHSLSKTEKRYISIELEKQKSRKGKIDLKLFNLLKKRTEADKEDFISYPEFNTTQKLIIRTSYLFDFILRCLIDYNYSREIEINIGNHIRIIKNFILKGLHQYTHYYLNKAQKLAEKYEDLYRLGILCSLRKIIINRSAKTHDEYFREVQKIEQQEDAVHRKIFNLNSYSNHLNHLLTALKKNSSMRLDKETESTLNEIISSPLFRKEENALTKKAKIIFHQVNAIYHEHITHDYKKALEHTEKQMALIKFLDSYQKVNSISYIACFKQYFIFAEENKQTEKAKEAFHTLEKMVHEKHASQNLFEQSFIFLNYLEAETRLALTDRTLERFTNSRIKINEAAGEFDALYDGESKMILYYNLALRCLALNEFKPAFRWLEKILEVYKGMRQDILEDAHILSLVCIYEIDSVNLFQSRERSYLRHYHDKSTSVHAKIIHRLAEIYQHKSEAGQAKKKMQELETFLRERIKNHEVDRMLCEAIFIWFKKNNA